MKGCFLTKILWKAVFFNFKNEETEASGTYERHLSNGQVKYSNQDLYHKCRDWDFIYSILSLLI